MGSQKLLDICQLCKAMDSMASRVYRDLQLTVGDSALSAFWRDMAADEARHLIFWNALIPLVEQGMIPEIFDEPEKILVDLKHNFDRAKELEVSIESGVSAKETFTIAFRLEYYLLHPVFEAFFSYARELRPIAESMGDEGDYEAHINKLITSLIRFCGSVPEMELLGDILRTLWEENRRLATTINTDPLTGLMNRRGFFNAAKPLLDLARRDEKNIGLILADLDDFKKYNAMHGHDAGDELLKSIGSALRQVVRSSDLVARFSGEEFMVLFYALEQGNLEEMAQKMAKTIKACSHNGQGMTASVGAASFDSSGPDGKECCVNLEEVLSQATCNLVKAKSSGANQIVTS